MCAVAEEGVTLNTRELINICNYYGGFDRSIVKSLKFSYFTSPVLSTVNIANRKGFLRLRTLENMLYKSKNHIESAPADLDPFWKVIIDFADFDYVEQVILELRKGITIPYAKYYKAMMKLDDILRIPFEESPVRDIA